MIHAENFLFVGPAVPFGGGGGYTMYSVFIFIFISSIGISSNDTRGNRNRMDFICLVKCLKCMKHEVFAPPPSPSANASCHTSLISRPKTVLGTVNGAPDRR